MKRGLTVESVGRVKDWGHIGFDTTGKFKHLQVVVGENIKFGVETLPVKKR